jgi:hypothetical protein
MINNYTAILEYLSNEIEEQSDKDVVEAIGIKYFKCSPFIMKIIKN